MKEFKGTKGEWKALDLAYVHKGNTDQCIADCDFNNSSKEDLANAKLIAAAPELLQACIDVCNADSQFKLHEARKACVLAIQKALK